jgi:uncharacterized protein (DUF924 family)
VQSNFRHPGGGARLHCAGKRHRRQATRGGGASHVGIQNTILLDQFPRNMFRGDGKAFSTDQIALAAAKMAVGRDWDLRIDPPARAFFYLPLMHSENLSDQDRCMRLIKTRLAPDLGYLIHAKCHREVIRRFGRFPYRNEALGRATTKVESEFLENGGYGAVLRQFQAASQA